MEVGGSLAGLESEMRRCGVDLIKELKSLLMAWAGMKQDDLRRLNSRLVLLVVFPVQEGAERSVNDLRAFITGAAAGEGSAWLPDGLCLSGGGYRAMIYHVGALVRLNELGFLPKLREVASVSGGSITAGMLAAAWPKLRFDDEGRAVNLVDQVADPLIRFAAVGVDVKAILMGLLPGRTAADEVAAAYDRHLFAGATLQDIPDEPRFTFMATNLQTGSGWRFAKAYAYRGWPH
jgi:predicted acylesterase/phospholipase RssA